MSWITINIILSLQIFTVILMMVNVQNSLRIVQSVFQWTVLLPNEMEKARERVCGLLKLFRIDLFKMIRNTKFIVVCATLVVVANLFDNPILYVPLYAGIGFTIGSAIDIYRIHLMGHIINHETDAAEKEAAMIGLSKIPTK